MKNDPELVNSERIGILLESQSLLNDWIENLRDDSSYNPDTSGLEVKIKAKLEVLRQKDADVKANKSTNKD